MAEGALGSRRLFKVWSADRRIRKAVMATTLAELIDAGCTKLGYTHQVHRSDVRVVLEADGTHVEDEQTFGSLLRDTVLLLMLPGQAWLPPSVEAIKTGPGIPGIMLRPQPVDAVDAPARSDLSSDFVTQTLGGVNGADLLLVLMENVGRIALLSEEQLEAIGSMQEIPPDLPVPLARRLVEVCDQMQINKKNCREALATIELLKQNVGAADEVDRTLQSPLKVDQSTQTQFGPVLRQKPLEGPECLAGAHEGKRRRTDEESDEG